MGAEHVIETWVRGLFIELTRLAATQASAVAPPSAVTDLFPRFLEALDHHFHSLHSVAGYCALLHCPPYLLNNATVAAANQKASEVSRARVVQEAKRLLLFTALDVAGVAFTLGFEDAAHFGRMFRREVGMSPGRWREAQQLGAWSASGPEDQVRSIMEAAEPVGS